MILSRQNLKYLFAIFVIAFVGYILGAKEVRAHRPEWQLSRGFATCEEVVNFLNLEQVHTFYVVTESSGRYRVIFED